MRSTNDPIEGLKKKILNDWGIVTEAELKSIEKECREMVDEEVAQAEASPEPDSTPQTLFKDIYVWDNPLLFLIREYFLTWTRYLVQNQRR